MTDFIRQQVKNRGDRYTREVAAEQLKRIGLTLAPDFYPDRTRERLKNRGTEFTRKTADAMAKRAGVRVSDDFSRHTAAHLNEEEFIP